MKKISKLLVVCLFLGVVSKVSAQYESQYTQYMYNTTLYNPAYAGSRGVGSIFGVHRSQWLGIDGAPRTSTISYNTPVKGTNLGLGVSLFNESIGPETKNFLMIDLSYALDFERSRLAFGLKGTLGLSNIDKNKLKPENWTDQVLASIGQNLYSPNIGPGVFWYSDNYYLGLSIPYLLETESYNTKGNQISVVKNIQHIHFLGGYVFQLNDNFKFKPAFISKIVKGAPLQLDVSANFMYNERFVLGGAWRWGASISGLAGFQINKNWFMGYSYDFDTTELAQYSSGSHEVFLRYEFFDRIKKKIMSPRFF